MSFSDVRRYAGVVIFRNTLACSLPELRLEDWQEFVTFSIELAGVHAILAMRVPRMVLYLAQTMSLDASSIRCCEQLLHDLDGSMCVTLFVFGIL